MRTSSAGDGLLIWGGRRLQGSIEIGGAKNAALPILAASLLCSGKATIHNVPRLGDVQLMVDLLRSIGARIDIQSNTLSVRSDALAVESLSESPLAGQIRCSTHLIGALLPRFREIVVPFPGGCKIGTRGLDLHILGLTSLGARICMGEKHIRATKNELRGADVTLRSPSVGATENTMILACLAEGRTTVRNAAREPEVVDLALFLNSMGAQISGAGTEIIQIIGVDELCSTEYEIMPDRIETGTYMVAAAITGGDVLLRKTRLDLLHAVASTLAKIGVHVEEEEAGVRVRPSGKLHPAHIVTEVYPGFPTDMQPIIAPLLARANGRSTVKETLFERRFGHVSELVKMGANIRVSGDTVLIEGPSTLRGSTVNALDIRSGAALIVAGLAAEGQTVIKGVDQIIRGYEDPVGKLTSVGAKCALANSVEES